MAISFRPNRAYPSLPTISGDPESHTRVLELMKEAMAIYERRTKNYLDSFVRVGELVDLGLINVIGNSVSSPGTVEWSSIVDADTHARDAVGGILTDTAEIDFTYNSGTPSITALIVAVPDAKLSSNVALLNRTPQTFTGDNTFTSRAFLADGTISLPSLAFTSAPTTGFYYGGASTPGIFAAATSLRTVGTGAVVSISAQTTSAAGQAAFTALDSTGAFAWSTGYNNSLTEAYTLIGPAPWRIYKTSGGTLLRWQFAPTTGHLTAEDNVELRIGTGGDLALVHTGTATNVTNGVGQLTFTNTAREVEINGSILDLNANLDVSGTALFASTVELEAAAPLLLFDETDAAANERAWLVSSAAGVWRLSTATDAAPTTASANAIAIDRTGTTVSEIELNATLVEFNTQTVQQLFSTSGTVLTTLRNTNSAGFSALAFVDAAGATQMGLVWGNSTSATPSAGYLHMVNGNDFLLRSSSTERWRFLGASGHLRALDSVQLNMGTSDDFTLTHNGTDTVATNGTGQLTINNLTREIELNATTLDFNATTMDMSGDILMSGTGYLGAPDGTTAQRPGSPSNGMIRYNTDDDQFEGYSETAWVGLSGPSGSLRGDWKFDTNTASADPGTKEFRVNNATPASVTEVYINETTNNGGDAAGVLGFLTTGDRIYIQQINNSAKALLVEVSGATTDNGSWWTIPVTVLNSGTIFDSGATCGINIMFAR